MELVSEEGRERAAGKHRPLAFSARSGMILAADSTTNVITNSRKPRGEQCGQMKSAASPGHWPTMDAMDVPGENSEVGIGWRCQSQSDGHRLAQGPAQTQHHTANHALCV